MAERNPHDEAPSACSRADVVLCSPGALGRSRKAESLGIRYLDAFLMLNGIQSKIVDAHCWGLEIEATAAEILAAKPRVLGLQLIFHEQIPSAEALARAVKAVDPEILIVTGGHVATFSAEDLLLRVPLIDCAVRGEGENSFLEIVRGHLAGSARPYEGVAGTVYSLGPGFVEHAAGNLITPLDVLPFPTRDSRDYPEFRHASVIASRGCYYKCNFCSVPEFFRIAKGPLWRIRSVENVLAELDALVAAHGITHVSFVDDIFLGTDNRSQTRAIAFAEALRARSAPIKFSIECRTDAVTAETFSALKKAGLERVFLGLEAGSDEGLRLLDKLTDTAATQAAIDTLRSLGVAISFGFINFHPDATLQTILDNVGFLHDLDLAYPSALCTRLIAYPGTPIWRTLRDEGRLGGDPLFPTYEMGGDLEALYQAYREVFASRQKIDLARRRAEFAMSFKSDVLGSLARDYDRTCGQLSDTTATVAREVGRGIANGTESWMLQSRSTFERLVEPLIEDFQRIAAEAEPYKVERKT